MIDCNINELITIKSKPDPYKKNGKIYRAYWRCNNQRVCVSNVPTLAFRKQELIDGIVLNWNLVVCSQIKSDIDIENPF